MTDESVPVLLQVSLKFSVSHRTAWREDIS